MSKRKSDGWITQRKDGRWNVGYGNIRTVRSTKAAALVCLRELRLKGEKEKGPRVTGTVRDFTEWWLRNVLHTTIKPSTMTSYVSCIGILLEHLGDMQMRAIKTSDIQRAINEMTSEGTRAETSVVALRALTNCYQFYITEGALKENPCLGVKPPISKKRQMVTENLAYNGNEMRAILSETKRYTARSGQRLHKYWYVYLLLAYTGMRVGELLYLRWKHIDFRARTVTVEGDRLYCLDIETGKRRMIDQNTPKTETSNRVIPLNNVALEVLEELYDERNPDPDDYIVVSTKGLPIDCSRLDRSFYRILKNARVPKKNRHGVHALRHTFATELIANNVPIKVVSQLLGHSSVAVTLNIYVHHQSLELDEAVNAISGY